MKKTILLTIISGMLLFSCKHECPPGPESEPTQTSTLANGLAGHYPFTGNANDVSGFSNHGTVNGPILTTDRFGNANQAYLFDGANDYISVSPGIFLNNEYSYCAWVKINTLPASGTVGQIISIGVAAGDHNLSVNNNYFTSHGFAVGGHTSSTTTVNYSTGALPSAGTWYHLVSTWDSSTLKLYINGQLAGTAPTPTSTPYYGTTGQSARFGVRSHSNTQFLNGAIDEIRIYNRPLTASEVSDLYKLQ